MPLPPEVTGTLHRMGEGDDPEHSANIRYTRRDIGDQYQISVSCVFHHMHNIPDYIARPLGFPWIDVGSSRQHRWRWERKQSGVVLWLRNEPHKPPLLSLYLSNARSLVHKMDDLELRKAGNR